MAISNECFENTDPGKLVREGTSQDKRLPNALAPDYAPVNERTIAHSMVFAQRYAALLKYFDSNNSAFGDWSAFFGNDVSVQLATAAVEDVDAYKTNIQSWFDYLNRFEHRSMGVQLKNNLGYLFSYLATLAQELDKLMESLPAEIALKGTLQNLVKNQLAPVFKRLIAYYKAGHSLHLINAGVPSPSLSILRGPVVSMDNMLTTGLSEYWSEGLEWSIYLNSISSDASVYGGAGSAFVRINHCSTHNLFTSIFDQFLKVFSRTVAEAKDALEMTLKNWNKHEPHYALFLAFLRLFEYARESSNTLTQRHLDFYYREILCLKEKSPEPGHVHLVAELARQVGSHHFAKGTLFKAGKDSLGHDVFFANNQELVANQAKVVALKTVYRLSQKQGDSDFIDDARIYASPVANSEDGLGAELTSIDQSWHPFFNKIYLDDALARIQMPEAEIGFAIASHYLLLAEGNRRITLLFKVNGYSFRSGHKFDGHKSKFELVNFADDIRCYLTTEKSWLEKVPTYFYAYTADIFVLTIDVSGAEAPVVPYSPKVHGHNFQTELPLLMIKLKQSKDRPYAYSIFQNVVVKDIRLLVKTNNARALAVSNDFGPVDTSKPFQPFGPSPINGSSMLIGSKEIFQKTLNQLSINLTWLNEPAAYPSTALPNVSVDLLVDGQWQASENPVLPVDNNLFDVSADNQRTVLDQADFSANEYYSTASRKGFLKLKLNGDFGQAAFQTALISYLRKDPPTATNPGTAPIGPTAEALSIAYSASADLPLNTSANYETRTAQYFHLAPFGVAEQHPFLNTNTKGKVFLFPQFTFVRDNSVLQSEAELYIGISGLKPPQNLSLLFQVVDGTANPRALKPKPHIDWHYLKNNEWIAFAKNEVQDSTNELLSSGIVTFAIPRSATDSNTLLSDSNLWLRAAVHEKSDAICKLQLVAAQAMQAVFVNHDNASDFSENPLPAATIRKLAQPDAAAKSISQPFASFGGRGGEHATAFYTRISERLRHKDRGIGLWDYEHLVLEAFPQIYQVKCLNHTRYDEGIYRELAPGHVTLITIPRLQTQYGRNTLKPFTSLGVLEQIASYLKKRTSSFAQLHVRNPQFEEVRLSFKLHLFDGYDETFYSATLKQAITRFLSPWAFTADGRPSFGGKIHKSTLINFIEDQPYVDYVTDFRMFQDIAGVSGVEDLDEVAGSRAISILVSVPADKHEIVFIHPAQELSPSPECGCEA